MTNWDGFQAWIEGDWGERESKKYLDAVELTIELEKKDRYGMSAEAVKALEPRDLYDCLQSEWWREWNGLLQKWENTE